MPELRALDLFEGGEKGVYTRMVEIIKRGLEKKVKEIRNKRKRKVSDEKVIKIIAEQLNVDTDRLIQIYHSESSNGDVNYGLFDRLEVPLDLSIHRVLGKPTTLDKPAIKEKWDTESKKHPILGAAALISNTPRDKCKVTQRDELELYVTLRAIRELHLSRQ